MTNNDTGKTFVNANYKPYFIIYENKELDRTLLFDYQTQTYVGAYGINWKSMDWAQGHYFMEDFESAVNWVLGKEIK